VVSVLDSGAEGPGFKSQPPLPLPLVRHRHHHGRTAGEGRRVVAPLSWRRGVVVSGVRRMNEVNARRARLVPGWVTVFGRAYHLGM